MWRARPWKCDFKRKRSLEWLLSGGACARRWTTSVAQPASAGEASSRFVERGWSLQSGCSSSLFQRLNFDAEPRTALSPNPYQESVSTIDTAVCSLPVLTNHMRQCVPLKFSFDQSDRSQFLRGSLSWPEHCRSSEFKAFASVAQAVENFDTDAEEVICEPAQMEDIAEPGVSNRMIEYSTEPGMSKRMAKEDSYKMKQNHRTLVRRQRQMETEACLKASKDYQETILKMYKKKLAPNVPFVRSLLVSWFEPFRDAILAEQEAITKKEFLEDRSNYGPFLLQLPADMLAVVAMHRLTSLIMKEHEHGCVRVVTAATAIGEAVEQEVEILRILNKRRKKQILCSETDGASEINTDDIFLEKSIKKMIKHHNVRLLGKTLKKSRTSKPWGSAIQAKVGSRLIQLLMDVAHLQPTPNESPEESPEFRPALMHTFKTYIGHGKGHNRVFGVISCDPLVWKSLEKLPKFLEQPYMPMLVEPRPWKGYKEGGYLVLRTQLMRIHGAKSQQIAITRTKRSQLKNVFEALNTLGRTPWRICQRVHDVVEKVWSDGGNLANMVERADLPIPEKPDTTDEEEMKKWKKQMFKAKRTNSERHSQRCDVELKLSIARKYRDEPFFYYPHNLDFRGRAYPMPPHLNHLGSDLCRGILEFAEGRPLGRSGFRWLKIHLANLYAGGVDKLSFDGRVAFVDEHIDSIIDSAARPLEGDRWWLQAEDPFQCLAACMNIRDALECGDVENFVCHLPVHQDGSCNGLQHYAALGRDRVGAESVNLVIGEKPADVYSEIAVRVRQMMASDAQKDPATNKNAASARLLLEHVDRKLVKQTVMTSVYGVTFIGARSQILNRLEERGTVDSDEMFMASAYAAKTTLVALGEMFKEARCIMGWLGDCAKLIASENEPVRWTTPLGLPVVQPYRKPGWKQIKTSLQVLTLRNDSEEPVIVQRQKTAFPPNFVHSLDSSHMMMTAIACHKEGLHFAGVHDSFWTHAADVERMNNILRKTFIELYSQPILENLLKGFEGNFPTVRFPPVPERGDFDMREVLGAPYFFN